MIPASLKDITADWLNDVLHSSRYLEDVNIESIEQETMAVGEGFVSDMARITLKYDRDAPHLPKTIIAKFPVSFESANAVAMLFRLYEREVRFYSEVAKKSPIRTPGLVYCDMDLESNRFALLLEDCACYQQVDQIKGLDYETTKRVALMLADFHAHWWDTEELESLTWMPGPGSPEAMALVDTYVGGWDFSVQSELFTSALPEGGREAGEKIRKQYPLLMENAASDKLTITHFDFRVDNLFFDFENRENPVIVFDWGSASKYRGVIDLSYFLGGSITVDLRRQIEKEIIKIYHQRLLENGVSGYSYDECWEDYLMGTILYAYLPVLAFSSLDMSDERAKELGKLIINRHFATIVDNNSTSIFP
jgi:hypothetical protein